MGQKKNPKIDINGLRLPEFMKTILREGSVHVYDAMQMLTNTVNNIADVMQQNWYNIEEFVSDITKSEKERVASEDLRREQEMVREVGEKARNQKFDETVENMMLLTPEQTETAKHLIKLVDENIIKVKEDADNAAESARIAEESSRASETSAGNAEKSAEKAREEAVKSASSASSALYSLNTIKQEIEDMEADPDTDASVVAKIAEHTEKLTALGSDVSQLDHKVDSQIEDNTNADFSISDEKGNAIAQFSNGHVKTKNFDSGKVPMSKDNTNADFSITDENGNAIVIFRNGHIITKNFNSENMSIGNDSMLIHILLLGQSLSTGVDTQSVLNRVQTQKALMFKHLHTYDLGYMFGVSVSTYNNDQSLYDNELYKEIKQLKEEGGYGDTSNNWAIASSKEFESPMSGIVEGLLNEYKNIGVNDLPFMVLCTASGIGGEPIGYWANDSGTMQRTKRDLSNGFALANKLGLSYRPIFVWMQGETNISSQSIDFYKEKFSLVHSILDTFVKEQGIYNKAEFITYQTSLNPSTNALAYGCANSSIAQFELAKEVDWLTMAYPYYDKMYNTGYLHMTNIGSRSIGNSIGVALWGVLNGGFDTLRISSAELQGNNIIVKFNKEIEVDSNNRYWGGWSASIKNNIDTNYGFIAYNSSLSSVISSVTKIDDKTIKIVCTDTPSSLYYGVDKDLLYCRSGIIREKIVHKGYNNSNLYLYMPVQIIKEFSQKFNFVKQ